MSGLGWVVMGLWLLAIAWWCWWRRADEDHGAAHERLDEEHSAPGRSRQYVDGVRSDAAMRRLRRLHGTKGQGK